MTKYYIIDPNKTLEENIKARDTFYTEEKMQSYTKSERDILNEIVLNDKKFEELYNLKASNIIRFIDLSQKKYEMIIQM